MSDLGSLLGVGVGTNSPNLGSVLEHIQELYSQEKIGWLQVYIHPDSPPEALDSFKSLDLNLIVHGAHEDHGFNLDNGASEDNLRIADLTLDAAKYLKAKMVVFHTGYFDNREGPQPADLNRLVERDQLIDEFLGQIKEKFQGVAPVLFENVSPWFGEKKSIFVGDYEYGANEFSKFGFGLCFDLAKLAFQVNHIYEHVFDAPPPELLNRYGWDLLPHVVRNAEQIRRKWHEEHKRHARHVDGFLELQPALLHTRGVSIGDLFKYPQPMRYLNNLQLKTALPYALKNQVPIILEVSQTSESFERAIGYLSRFESKMKSKKFLDTIPPFPDPPC